ncbi:MAG: histidine phosphatase family protein [Thermomonas sp.]
MRQLILLRHAHAESAGAGEDDAGRPLSDTGRAEARAAGVWMREHGIHPDRVLSSPSTRTRETWAAVEAELDSGLPVHYEPAIYEATPGALIALADANRDAARLVLVGHNPGLEQLLALLNSGQSGDYRGMPPGAVAVLGLPVEAAIEPGIARLDAFWWP